MLQCPDCKKLQSKQGLRILRQLSLHVSLQEFEKSRTVAEALTNMECPRDIHGGLSLAGIREFLQLWDCLLEIILTDQEDRHTWRLDTSGCYSSKSVYKAFFYGAVTFEPWCRL